MKETTTDTPMAAKEYLSQVGGIGSEIESLRERINELSIKAMSVSRSFTRSGTRSKSSESRHEKCINAYVSLQDYLRREIERVTALEKEIIDVIANVKNSEYRELLRYRYCLRYEWKRMGRVMHYSARHLRRLHAKAILEVEDIINRKNAKPEANVQQLNAPDSQNTESPGGRKETAAPDGQAET